jgi:hypothetical protein
MRVVEILINLVDQAIKIKGDPRNFHSNIRKGHDNAKKIKKIWI